MLELELYIIIETKNSLKEIQQNIGEVNPCEYQASLLALQQLASKTFLEILSPEQNKKIF